MRASAAVELVAGIAVDGVAGGAGSLRPRQPPKSAHSDEQRHDQQRQHDQGQGFLHPPATKRARQGSGGDPREDPPRAGPEPSRRPGLDPGSIFLRQWGVAGLLKKVDAGSSPA